MINTQPWYEDEYEHYNYDQDKAMFSGHSGKQRSKKEAEQNTNRYNTHIPATLYCLVSYIMPLS